jgi:hypothetical protein
MAKIEHLADGGLTVVWEPADLDVPVGERREFKSVVQNGRRWVVTATIIGNGDGSVTFEGVQLEREG